MILYTLFNDKVGPPSAASAISAKATWHENFFLHHSTKGISRRNHLRSISNITNIILI